MKKLNHKNASRIIGGNSVCGNTQYFWVRDDDGSSNYVCLKREECASPGDKYGNAAVEFNKVASSFCGR